MARLSRQQWQALIVEFENSGQTQTEFCKQRDLNPKYFSLKRSKLIADDAVDRPAFTEVVLAPPRTCGTVEITLGKVTITVPQTTPPAYLAGVIRALA